MRVLIIVCSFITVQLLAQNQNAKLAPRIIEVNGKYGIMDENGKTVVLPENDSIIPSVKYYLGLRVNKINPIFFIKKNNKFAFAYQIDMDTAYDYYDFPKEKIRWYTSEFLYDAIEEVTGWTDGFNYRSRNPFHPSMFVTLKYKFKGKWGLVYIPFNQAYSYYYNELVFYPGYLGSCIKIEARCDSIGKRHRDRLYDVKINDKWALWRIIASNKWINYLYPEYFDTLPKEIGTEVFSTSEYFVPFYRFVKKGGKWGVIKINPDTTEMKYIVPCHCDTVVYGRYEERFNNSDIIFLCKQRKQNKIVVYYNNQKLDINLPDKPLLSWRKLLRVIDTLPNEEMEAHLKYAPIEFSIYDKVIKERIDMGYCLVDLSRHKSTLFINDSVTKYNLHFGYHGILIEKQIKTALGTQCEYIDFETGVKKLVIKPKANTRYKMSSGIVDDYPYIIEFKVGKDSKSKYYYNFREKKFRKGRHKM